MIQMTLRVATMEDADLLLGWRNDPVSVAASGNSAAVTQEEHQRWLIGQLSPYRIAVEMTGLFIAEVKGVPVGTGRIEVDMGPLILLARTVRLSYAVGAKYRSRGCGIMLVKMLVHQARIWGCRKTVCYIKRNNDASIKCAINGGVDVIVLLRE